MRTSLFLVSILAGAASLSSAKRAQPAHNSFLGVRGCEGEWYSDKVGITTLCKDAIAEDIKKDDTWVVEFYAPWCPACKAFKDGFMGAALKLKDSKAHIGAVDCDANKELCTEVGIEHYPTVKGYRHGEWEELETNADEILSFAKSDAKQSFVHMEHDKHTLVCPVSAKHTALMMPQQHRTTSTQKCDGEWYRDEDGINALCEGNFPDSGSWLVEFYAPWCPTCQSYKSAIHKLGSMMKGVKVGAVDCDANSKLCDDEKIKYYPTFRHLTKGDWDELELPGGDAKTRAEALKKDVEGGKRGGEKGTVLACPVPAKYHSIPTTE